MGEASTFFAAGFTNNPSYNLVMYNLPGFSKVPDFTVYNDGAAQDSAFTRQVDKFAILRSASSVFNCLSVYETTNWNKINTAISLPGVNNFGCDFNLDGSILVACAGNGAPYLCLVDTTTWNVSGPTEAAHSYPLKARFNKQGTLCAVGFANAPHLKIYNTATWTSITGPASLPSNRVNWLDWSEDGSLLACSCSVSGEVSLIIYDTSNWSRMTTDTLPNFDGRSVAIRPDGKFVALSTASSPYGFIYEDVGGAWLRRSTAISPLPSLGASFNWSSDGSILAMGTYASPWCIYYDTSDNNSANWTQLPNPTDLPLGNVFGGRFDYPLGAPLAATKSPLMFGSDF